MLKKNHIDRSVLDGANILLVEDNRVNQDVAQAMLNQRGMQVAVAENGEKAVEMVGSHKYDCILMDIQMPVMDGNVATRKIREELNKKNLPILAMSAKVLESDIKEALDSGMNCHISKPIDLELLLDEMAFWIGSFRKHSDSVGKAEEFYEEVLADCLQRVGGDMTLFLKIIKVFLEKHADDYEEVVALLGQGDTVAARKCVHNLKGVTLVVGAEDLHYSAVALEKAIDEQKKNIIPQLLKQFQTDMGKTVSYLTRYLNNHSE